MEIPVFHDFASKRSMSFHIISMQQGSILMETDWKCEVYGLNIMCIQSTPLHSQVDAFSPKSQQYGIKRTSLYDERNRLTLPGTTRKGGYDAFRHFYTLMEPLSSATLPSDVRVDYCHVRNNREHEIFYTQRQDAPRSQSWCAQISLSLRCCRIQQRDGNYVW